MLSIYLECSDRRDCHLVMIEVSCVFFNCPVSRFINCIACSLIKRCVQKERSSLTALFIKSKTSKFVLSGKIACTCQPQDILMLPYIGLTVDITLCKDGICTVSKSLTALLLSPLS